MLPNVAEGTELTISLSLDNIKVNDLIVFNSIDNSKLICHRVLAIHKNFFICKGDNFSYLDPIVPVDHCIGKVTKKIGRKNLCSHNIDIIKFSNETIDFTKKNVLILDSISFNYILQKYSQKLESPVLMDQDIRFYYGSLENKEIDSIINCFCSIYCI